MFLTLLLLALLNYKLSLIMFHLNFNSQLNYYSNETITCSLWFEATTRDYALIIFTTNSSTLPQ